MNLARDRCVLILLVKGKVNVRHFSTPVMAGLDPRLSGLILVDEAHGMDSSVV
jgi:hypothetical protein